ncbi:MAG: hypothetical protein NVV70_17310 [Cellulomonas sp.]|nr:hypothetical protein [Cellulomonas sp.]MCR6649806.1 hypothetical protein [Cellulomonas sp.]
MVTSTGAAICVTATTRMARRGVPIAPSAAVVRRRDHQTSSRHTTNAALTRPVPTASPARTTPVCSSA